MSENSEVEALLQETLDRVAARGILFDQDQFDATLIELSTRMATLQAGMLRLGYTRSPSSRKDVAYFLFDHEHLPPTRKRSVSKEALRFYDHPFLSLYHEHSTVSRTRSLMAKMPDWLAEGRLHTTWHGTNETSGRIYCTDFNVQQLPIVGRKTLIPDPGKSIFMADYKAIELRVLAAVSRDELLLTAIYSADPHRTVAGDMLGKPSTEVTDAERERGKVFNYGLIYGMEPSGLALRLNISEAEAEVLQADFFAKCPTAIAWIAKFQEEAIRTGSVTNAFGHTRWLDPGLPVDKRMRQAINTYCQGTAASILKRAILRLAAIERVEILATVHDSIVCQYDPEFVDPVYLAEEMATEFMGVPFPVDWAVSDQSWGQAQLALKNHEEEE